MCVSARACVRVRVSACTLTVTVTQLLVGSPALQTRVPRWKDFAEDESYPRDKDGPPKAPLRLKILIGTFVNEKQGFEKTKEVVLSEAAVKTPTGDDIRTARTRIQSDHDRLFCDPTDGTSLDTEAVANKILAAASVPGSSSSAAFDGHSLALAALGDDLESALAQTPTKTSESAQASVRDDKALSVWSVSPSTPPPGTAGARSCAESLHQGSGKCGKGRSSNAHDDTRQVRVEHINKAHRAHMQSLRKLYAQAQANLETIQALAKDVQSKGWEAAVVRELKTAQTRLNLLRALLATPDETGNSEDQCPTNKCKVFRDLVADSKLFPVTPGVVTLAEFEAPFPRHPLPLPLQANRFLSGLICKGSLKESTHIYSRMSTS